MDTEARIGSVVAGYRLESVLGRGGMSVVYLAEDLTLHRRVALKVLSPELARDSRFRSRFIRESQMAAGLDHPNIVPIYQAGEDDGLLFIAMRYIRGSDLRTLIEREGRLAPARVASIIRQAANALDAAHAQGLVHRDVKPANLLLAPGPDPEQPDQVYLSDFGLTKRPTSRSGLTNTGQFIGTVDYMAPEQIQGKGIDGRVDVYSLGCVMYECLTGDVPYPKDNEVAVIYAHLQEPPPPVTALRPELDPEVDQVAAKAMAKDPDDRYPTCLRLATAARAALGDESQNGSPATSPPAVVAKVPVFERPPRRRLPLIIGAGVLLLAVLAAVAFFAFRSEAPPVRGKGAALVPRGLVRIDPVTNRVVARIEQPQACCVTLVGETPWADHPDGVIKISQTTNAVVASIPDSCCVQSWLDNLYALRGAGAAVGADDLLTISPQENRVIHSARVRGLACPCDYDVGAAGVWGITTVDVVELDPTTGKVLRRVPLDIGSLSGSAVGTDAIWISDGPNGRVWRVDTATLEVKAVPVDDPSGIAITQAGVWVANGSGGVLVELAPDGGSVLDTVDVGARGNQTANLAVGAEALWMVDGRGGEIIRIDLASHEVVARIPVGSGPADIAADDRSVWVTR